MESGEHHEVQTAANKRKRGKVFMACISCRNRKISCDGKSPECSACGGRGLSCEYIAVRKMRGPGKKNKKGVHDLEDRVVLKAIPETQAEDEISEDSAGLESRLRQLYPVFLHPENHVQSIQELQQVGQEDRKSPEGFTPLVSQDMLHHALENTYGDITGVCPIFDLPTLQRLNSEQQVASNTHPAGNPARWAILSTWIAIGMRFRTALGSENGFTQVVEGYYRNAVLVLPDLILQAANMETVQALLLMAVFADGMEDHRSFVMLVTNATRQIELLALQLAGMLDRSERESYQRLISFAREQDRKVAEKYGLTSTLNSVFI